MNTSHLSYIRGLAMAVVLLLGLCAYAQNPIPQSDAATCDSMCTDNELEGRIVPGFYASRYVMHSTMFGIGAANVLDTYLSPYNYTGGELRVVRETMRNTRLMGGSVMYQTFIDANAAMVKNRPGNVTEYAGGIRYTNAWLYNFNDIYATEYGSRLRVMAGAAAGCYLGGVYNERNGNNPAQAKMDLTIDAEAVAMYEFWVLNCPFTVRYQINIPLLGCAFSPNYGQSYYELFQLGNYDHNIVGATPFNAPSWRHLLTLDFKVGGSRLRVGYAGEFMQSKFNGLKYHAYSHDFMVGWIKYFVSK